MVTHPNVQYVKISYIQQSMIFYKISVKKKVNYSICINVICINKKNKKKSRFNDSYKAISSTLGTLCPWGGWSVLQN